MGARAALAVPVVRARQVEPVVQVELAVQGVTAMVVQWR